MNIIYAALCMSAQTEKTTFSCKDDCTLTKHTGRWTYSAKGFEIPLCHTPPLRSFFGYQTIKQIKSYLLGSFVLKYEYLGGFYAILLFSAIFPKRGENTDRNGDIIGTSCVVGSE